MNSIADIFDWYCREFDPDILTNTLLWLVVFVIIMRAAGVPFIQQRD